MVIASAVTALAVATRPSPLLSLLTGQRVLKFKALCCSSEPSRRKLVLYSKPGCCLCDGLKEKLQAAFLLSGPDSLGNVDLQVSLSLSVIVSCMNMRFFFFDLMFWVFYYYQIRDITSNPEWEKAYQYEIPVLAKVLSDGTEVCSVLFQTLTLFCFFPHSSFLFKLGDAYLIITVFGNVRT